MFLVKYLLFSDQDISSIETISLVYRDSISSTKNLITDRRKLFGVNAFYVTLTDPASRCSGSVGVGRWRNVILNCPMWSN